MRTLIVFFLFVAFSLSCTYNSEEDLYGTICDTTIINYSIVEPIFQGNCISCHNATLNYEGILLNTFENAVSAAQTGRLINAVNHLPGATPMPFGGSKLPECEVRKITIWIEQGTPE